MQKKFVGVDKAHGEDAGAIVEGYYLNGVYTVTKESIQTMANSNLEATVKIDPSSAEVINLIRAANYLLYFREGIIAKEYDKFSHTLCGALHDLAMAVKAVEQCTLTDSDLKKCPSCGADEGDCFVWCPRGE